MKRPITVEVTARFTFKVDVEMADDEEGLTAEEETAIEDATQQALAGFEFRDALISPADPPCIEVTTVED